MPLTPAFAVTTGLLTVVVFVVLDRLALATIRPRRKVHARNVRTLSFRRREHEFTSLGQELKGWFLEPEVDRGGAVVVLVHGWGSSHGRMTVLAEPLLEGGYPVFLFDVRYHGESPDAPYVTARHFRDDTMAATREAHAAYPGRPLVLIGHSMGGSAAVLAVAEGAPAAGLVTIAAPADLWDVWADSFRRRGLPGKLIVRLFNPFWRNRAGVPFRTLRPERRVAEVDIPLLVFHGSRDLSVPPEHARLLARGAGVEPVIVEGADHNNVLGNTELQAELFTFLERVG